ncbi:Flagellar protein FlgJ [peptidoglycan hydrolase] [hydrothermal vent metagenome]|uniref:Peptidoglycan hydrolase FlgJ n=1 Tax=hydrothermal vent metagenome TaxID=652676 RepID=A0A3B0XRA8_9ZZZZ
MQTSSAIYNDFQALGALKKGARENSPEAIKQVAQQFESLFVQMMLKSMRDTVPENELFGSNGEKMYQEMYDKQLSQHISNGRGMGLAKVIERQLGGVDSAEIRADKSVKNYFETAREFPQTMAGKTHMDNAVIVSKLQRSTASLSHNKLNNNNNVQLESEKENLNKQASFINKILPYALRASEKLGVDAGVLIAQSALETGWGQYLPAKANGLSGNNFFGLKADQRWQGEKIEIATLEYRHGVMQQEKAEFRAYDSASQAFEDYTDFIFSNPRYQQALEVAYDAEAYARELQKAGYATDPDYASKINRIRNDKTLQARLSELTSDSKGDISDKG